MRPGRSRSRSLAATDDSTRGAPGITTSPRLAPVSIVAPFASGLVTTRVQARKGTMRRRENSFLDKALDSCARLARFLYEGNFAGEAPPCSNKHRFLFRT